jgi:gas vesicle protein
MTTTGKVFTGILVGASVGIITGILIAPDSGKRTREKLANKAKELKTRVEDTLDEAKAAYNKEVESLMANGKSGINSLKNALKV